MCSLLFYKLITELSTATGMSFTNKRTSVFFGRKRNAWKLAEEYKNEYGTLIDEQSELPKEWDNV